MLIKKIFPEVQSDRNFYYKLKLKNETNQTPTNQTTSNPKTSNPTKLNPPSVSISEFKRKIEQLKEGFKEKLDQFEQAYKEKLNQLEQKHKEELNNLQLFVRTLLKFTKFPDPFRKDLSEKNTFIFARHRKKSHLSV